MRKLGAGAMAGIAGLVVGASGVGVAGAATGGSFLLGQVNHESTTASLASDKGAPLSLRAAKGEAPLAVNNPVLVRHLNAALLGGLPASALQRRLAGQCGGGIASVGAAGTTTCATPQVVITASRNWVVPAGVHLLTVQAVGGGGGGATGAQRAGGGGAGASVTESVPVRPGERLDIVIGKGGGGGSDEAAAGGGLATMIYRQSRNGEALIDAGGGHPGRPGSSAAACDHGTGGVPRRTPAAVPLAGSAGEPGSCLDGGGTPGWPGAGGAPGHAGSKGAAGLPGSVLITLAG